MHALANRSGRYEHVGVSRALAGLVTGLAVHVRELEHVGTDVQLVRRPSAADEPRQRIREWYNASLFA